MRNEGAGLFASLAESIATVRAAREAGAAGARLQVSHLKCGARAVWGRAAEAIAMLERARADGLDVAADQYPYTAAATTLATILPPSLLGLGVEECVAALGDHEVRDRVVAEMERGISGWENVAADPGWAGIRISFAPSHPDWAGRSLAELGADAGRRSGRSRARRPGRRPPGRVGRHRLHGRGRCRGDHGRALDRRLHRRRGPPAGPPDPRRGPAASAHVREHGPRARHVRARARARSALETAVAKLSGVPAARLGLRDRGVLREGAFADLVVLDPATVADVATYEHPSIHPIGIEHVVVNGRAGRAGRARRPASAPAACCDEPDEADVRATTPAVPATEAPAVAPLSGGPLPYTLRHSPRARGLRVVIHPERGVVVTVPATRSGRTDGERRAVEFLEQREPWVRRHLARHADVRAELAARGGARDGGSIRLEGRVVPIRVVPAVVGSPTVDGRAVRRRARHPPRRARPATGRAPSSRRGCATSRASGSTRPSRDTPRPLA